MPLLKNKIARLTQQRAQALELANNVKIEPAIEVKIEVSSFSDESYQPEPVKRSAPKTSKAAPKAASKQQNKVSASMQAKKSANSAKNIVKNFARAMVIFGISKLALPYISWKLNELKLDLKEFQQYLFQRKENMDGISSLRALLLVDSSDCPQTAAIKIAFQYTAEIFIKYFSVNWIYNSKLGDKLVHVKARYKILRRIRKPEYFTYFKM